VGFIVLLVLAALLSMLQHGLLATADAAPDLPLALLAWAVVAGDERRLLVRAWAIGLIRDCVDPGSVAFHTVAYFALALIFLPLRQMVFHGRAVAWIGWAVAASLLLTGVDRLLAGMALGAPWTNAALIAGTTGAATLALGWVLGGLPKAVRPIAEAGA
jgi:hypothetical protein